YPQINPPYTHTPTHQPTTPQAKHKTNRKTKKKQEATMPSTIPANHRPSLYLDQNGNIIEKQKIHRRRMSPSADIYDVRDTYDDKHPLRVVRRKEEWGDHPDRAASSSSSSSTSSSGSTRLLGWGLEETGEEKTTEGEQENKEEDEDEDGGIKASVRRFWDWYQDWCSSPWYWVFILVSLFVITAAIKNQNRGGIRIIGNFEPRVGRGWYDEVEEMRRRREEEDRLWWEEEEEELRRWEQREMSWRDIQAANEEWAIMLLAELLGKVEVEVETGEVKAGEVEVTELEEVEVEGVELKH
ncbi:hypothetical protein BU24DRAFT_482944, partial [Aaosphaeria arxii CBS 175.79]